MEHHPQLREGHDDSERWILFGGRCAIEGCACSFAGSPVAATVTGATREAQHSDPAWRERSDFTIGADVSAYADAADREQLELCCVPFFLYDVAWATS